MVASKKTSAAKAETGKTAAKTRKACAPKHIGIVKNDIWLPTRMRYVDGITMSSGN